MSQSAWLFIGFNLFVIILLALDLGLLHKKAREIKVKEALLLSGFYIFLAFLFALGIWHYLGAQPATEFVTGFLIEKSLSVDNIFVFVLIFSYFAVPKDLQHRVLFWGIIGALLMRGALIGLGSELVRNFHWVVFLFGGFLIFTGIKMLILADAKPDLDNNIVLKFLRKRLNVTDNFRGKAFFVKENAAWKATPLFLVLVLIEISDLVFAVDSIPAIFAVTTDPFIVYTSNVFAILGLRALYFALAGVVHKFHYLKYALSLVLILVGTKMIANGIIGDKAIPTEWALAATAILVFGSIFLSLIRGQKPDTSEAAYVGWVPGSPPTEQRKGK